MYRPTRLAVTWSASARTRRTSRDRDDHRQAREPDRPGDEARARAKLQEFAVYTDDQQEMVENEEQIEISRQYERMPKPTLIAAKEYEDGELYHNIAGAHPKK